MKIIDALQGQAPPGYKLVKIDEPKPKPKAAPKPTVIGQVIPNFPGALVRSPTEPKSSLQGLVLSATVLSKRKGKGHRYNLKISGAVPEVNGGWRNRDDLELMNKRVATIPLIRKLQAMTEDEASSYAG